MKKPQKENDKKPETIAVILLDDNHHIKSINQKALELIKCLPEELIGQSIEKIFCSKDETGHLTRLLRRTSQGCTASKQSIIIGNAKCDLEQSVLASVIPLPGEGTPSDILLTLDTTDQALHHQLLLNSLTEGVLTVNRELKITSFNNAAEIITGYSYDECVGKKCNTVFPPEICGDDCLIKASIEKEMPVFNRTVSMKNKKGHSFPLSFTSSPLYDSSGTIIGGVQIFHDCSDTLHKDLILSSVADGVFTVDKGQRITSFNKAAEQITGWQSADAIGKKCFEVFHASICGTGCLLQKAIEDNATHVDHATFIKDKSGVSIPVTISSAPLLDEFGNTVGGIETFRDNTRSIRESLILDSIADGVFTVDRNWNITSFNRAAEEITGWRSEDALGMSCSDIFHSSICGKNCAIAESLYTGTPVANRSITIRNHHGDKIPISISASPLTDHEGNIIGGVETFRDLTTITSLRKQLSQKFTFDEIISKAPSMQRLFSIMPDIARSPSTVLILGESGTGKELIARALFNASERKDSPFVTVNCGALPETLLESELFGYKAGAFTDARKDKEGRFAAAEGGTLFLDEIGDIPPGVQVKLLRVLQEKVYDPLGSNTPVKADVRIITATNKKLEDLVQQGSFRDDLFYRLNVVKIALPPLRERKEDIPLLIDHFIKKYSAQQGKDIVGMTGEAVAILMRYDFPGNIRELENLVEYAFILCEGGYIQPQHLPDPFGAGGGGPHPLHSAGAAPQTLEEAEKQAILLALERNKWKKMATCRELEVSKDTLRRKIKKYALTNPLDKQPTDE